MSSVKYPFPYEIKTVEPEVNEELLKYFKGERNGFVQVGPEKYFFPSKYKAEAEAYYNFEARSSDIWVVTFPRSGTTWTQELVWLLGNNLDFKAAKSRLLTERFPFFEFALLLHPEVKDELLKYNADSTKMRQFIEQVARPGFETVSEIGQQSRRFIKTHFPFSLLPPSVLEKKCKIIYVARNPKDVAISYYHLNRLFRTLGYVGDFERFWNYFERGLNHWMPYFSHIKEALAHRHLSNVLFLQYEDMLSDLPATIQQVAEFLDCRINAQGVDELMAHLNISNFRENPCVNGHEMSTAGFLNNGEAGFVRAGAAKNGSQMEFAENPDLMAKANDWIAENEIKLHV